MENKKIVSIFAIFAILFVMIGGRYNSYSLNEIVASNNRQNTNEKEEKFETVKGSKLKIGDYVNYDHTIQVDPNTKETIKVPEDKLTYTSIKGDLDNSGNGLGTQTVDVSGYKTKWRVYDIQGDQVLLMPETQPTAEIKTKSALGYLWWEKEAHNIAGLYGHGYGADETKEFNYEVGSRIPSEGDTRTETKTGTGARPMLLKDIEEAYGITTNERRQELSDFVNKNDYPVGSNNLTSSIYYPTLNKENARATEDTALSNATGDIGVSKTTKKLTDIKQEYYYVERKIYDDVNTGKDIKKVIIQIFNSTLGSRSFGVNSSNVGFGYGYITTSVAYSGGNRIGQHFSSGDDLGYGFSSDFISYERSLRPRPVVFLSPKNNYYKEQGESEYVTYSLIKEEKTADIQIQNPYDINLKNVNLEGMSSGVAIFDKNLGSPIEGLTSTNITRADGTGVIGDITYTVEGLPEDVAYDVVKKEVNGKEEVTIQIYPKEISVVAKINKKDIYDGAKFSYNISLSKNGTKINTKRFYETADGKVEIANYTNKEDMIDKNGNKIKYTLDYDNFNDTVRKDNTYYNNTFAKSIESNNNKVIYNLDIVYNKAKYEEAGKEKTGGTDKKQDIEEESKKRTELTNETNKKNKENDTKNSTSSIKIPYAGKKVSLPIITILIGTVYTIITRKKIINRNIAI